MAQRSLCNPGSLRPFFVARVVVIVVCWRCYAFRPDPAMPGGRVRPGVVGGGDGAGRGDVKALPE